MRVGFSWVFGNLQPTASYLWHAGGLRHQTSLVGSIPVATEIYEIPLFGHVGDTSKLPGKPCKGLIRPDQPSPFANCIVLFLANHQTTRNLSELTCIPNGQLVTKRHGSLASSPSSPFPMLLINMVFSNGPLWGHHSTLQHILYDAFTFKPRSDQGTHSRHLFLLRPLAALSFSAQWEKDV